jgi:two-component system invasion response regulator UvrY
MRILLVDDHPIVRYGSLRSGDWDLVVLDVTLPGASGLDVLKEIRRTSPNLPVLVLSMHPASQFARRAIAAGASGYLTKDSAATELLKAIEEIRRGRSYLNVRRSEWPPLGDAPAALHDVLSDREYQVLRMLGSGKKVSEIATSLGLSVKTISTYRIRLLEKLHMRSNAEVMRYAIENGIVDS